ncbi:BamA/TamA family outer membrane protein [Myxococcus llanfairpwllgwyngyllgogerychwyrndrobwllllantysiliogogogochensis]|uniref:BamA/TamA family outer membrane protein n=1 Tax=Myxococcus llanfairpwllgwyngyllgogerychwyrndrobwllllantysiliogogogochensis TaxID=2590453 RepID=A0A540X3H2_9BACT|nr:BamA/TamA family outer membrane protein [Myxococcus llanfairpwllgwyngyllgogerychwyrndrobwllllantysiliogogogochensis]TQF15795.1 BamA/TamA family outer membrane protein [Myxococcus llanfairpwllgwyngyllgogerychwyrndrobwllllantysiliogogogochensis]
MTPLSLVTVLGVLLASTPEVVPETPPQAPLDGRGKFSVVPFVLPAYQPETSFLLGGAGSLVYQPPEGSGRRESQVLLAAAASVRGQFTVLLQPDVYFLEDRLNLTATLSAARFPDRFYGMGANTQVADEEDFTPVFFELELSPKWRIAPRLYVGPTLRAQHVRITKRAEDGVVRNMPGAEGGDTLQLGLTALYDSRDNTLNPTTGFLGRLNLRRASGAWGSDYTFGLLRLDARRYVSLPWGQRHVLAFQGLVELRDGEPPFYDTGRLGGMELSRGYLEGRFRERQHLGAQVEYRAPLFWRLGGVAFASAATVARSLKDLDSGDIKPAGGVGLRFAPLSDVPVNIRLDVAYGSEPSFYLNIGEAF